ncbi:IMP-specific 5-nucleotidase [Chaetoceros tenuissimus]|uniref:IMP-specific 5'-nucleotidase 1 n=1 Tax=Chaetoceros tenuissimus TaxID=426638 RepID=A0AAD3HDK0_9STRA|nr:IMP-specific 5-nucleotidase [Chaetoceros tenuissimus]
MSFSSRRRNYLLTPHRKDPLIQWMKEMLNHSFVLDCLETTAADTFSHLEQLIEEHRMTPPNSDNPTRLQLLVPTVGTFHTNLPLRKAFIAYNKKYALTKRKYITISFNELRHILNLAQIMALRGEEQQWNPKEKSDMKRSLKSWTNSPGYLCKGIASEQFLPPLDLGQPMLQNPGDGAQEGGGFLPGLKQVEEKLKKIEIRFKGPKMITFDGDQTLYSDGANFEGNPQLANYLYLLLRHGVTIAVVTAAGYEYNREKYEMRLSGLLAYFKSKNLPAEDCERFYLFGGECNFLLKLGSDYRLHPIKERGAGGWMTATKFITNSPGNWKESEVKVLLDNAEKTINESMKELRLRGTVLRKRRAVGMYPQPNQVIPREALDETVLRVHDKMNQIPTMNLPFCAFNGGSDVWVDVGNKRVGVEILTAYLGIAPEDTVHVGDQFLNTGNDHAARGICPCIWITNPDETTYILKSILRLAGVPLDSFPADDNEISSDELSQGSEDAGDFEKKDDDKKSSAINLATFCQRASLAKNMDSMRSGGSD